MTLRVKPTTKPRRRSSWQSEERSQFWITAGFIAVIALALLALVGAVAFDYYNKHLRTIASVGGVGITVDQWAERAKLLDYRVGRAERRVREAIAASEIDATTGSSQLSELATRQQAVQTDALDDLIDLQLQSTYAAEQGVTVTPDDVQAAFQRETSSEERRKVQAVFVEPKAADEGAEPTAADREAALANAQKALADLNAGKSFAEVAAQYSTDASKQRGGDYGTLSRTNGTDAAWVEALFALPSGGTTDVVRGADGTYRIGRVTEIVPGTQDGTYLTGLREAGLDEATYRRHLEREVTTDKLVDKVVSDQLSGDREQVRLAEILIGEAQPTEGEEAPKDEGQVKTRHILYTPKDDPQGATDVPADDPAWKEAETLANAAADRLRAIADVAARETAFADTAKAESDDKGSGARGGQLDFTSRTGFVKEFSDPIFEPTRTPGEIIGPVKSDFGYHVIFWQAKRGPAAERIAQLDTQLKDPAADFAALAREHSEGQSAEEGGTLGWSTREQLEPEVADAVFAVAAGQVTGKLELDDGVRWYKVLEKGPRPLDPDQRSALLQPAEGQDWPQAFEQWYRPKFDAAETDGVITRDEEVTGGVTDPGVDESFE